MSLASGFDIQQLKAQLLEKHGLKSLDAANIKSSRGVSTGWIALDSFVASGGFPCGELSLLEGAEGLGALTLWLETAARLTTEGHRVAWVNSALDDREPFQLHPPTAYQRGVDLQKLFLVNTPSRQKRLWILQEILSSQLFSLVGCDLGEAHLPLRECRSLLMQARRSGAAVVFFHRRTGGSHHYPTGRDREPPAVRSVASLVLRFFSVLEDSSVEPTIRGTEIEVIRAAHRPVPQTLSRRDHHVDFITGPSLDPSLALAVGTRSYARSDD